MKDKLFKTENDIAITVIRVVLGLVLLGHGLQKAFGLFGGFGWNNTIHYFVNVAHIPAWLGGFVIIIESLGSVLLILGVAGRLNAALMIPVIIGAFVIDHAGNGFYMNWLGTQKGEGYEFDLLFIAMAIAVSIKGSGRFSVDRLLFNK